MKAIIAVPATLALVYRAHSHKSLTPGGIAAAALSAAAHAVHPWNLPFVLLVVFFLAGTRVTKIKKDVKATMTVPSQGTSGGEGPRTHVQVFANSLVASILSLLHAYQLHQRSLALSSDTGLGGLSPPQGTLCLSWAGDLLPIGIIANYAAMSADTFSSELGILSKSAPRLITSPTLRKVPRGTNGGVTVLGLLAGFLGSMIVVVAAVLFTPLCSNSSSTTGTPWEPSQRSAAMLAMTIWGGLGSVLDSVLGGLFQRTVRDSRSGRVVEGEGGVRVLVSSSPSRVVGWSADIEGKIRGGEGHRTFEKMHHCPDVVVDATSDNDDEQGDDDHSPKRYDAKNKHRRSSFGNDRPSRVVESGWDVLDNNDVNFLTALTMSVGAMAGAAWYWGVPLQSIMAP